MSARTRLAVFLLVCLGQLAWAAAAIRGGEARLEAGRVWRFRTAPVDPADLVRGRYVALAFRATQGPALDPEPFEAGEQAHALLAEGDDGFATIAGVTRRDPHDPDAFLDVRVRAQHGDTVRFEFPVDRLYLPEKKAPVAEELYRRRGGRDAWAEIRVHEGRATLLDVYLDGEPLGAAAGAELREPEGGSP